MSKATTRQDRLNDNQPENNEPLIPDEQQAAAGKQFGEHDSPEDLDFNKPFQNMNFDELENKAGEELTGNYLGLESINDGKPHNYFVVGHTTTLDQTSGEQKPAVKLVGKGEKGNINYVCAAIKVVRACEGITEFPKAIRIIVNGKEKGKNGSYWNAQVFAL